MKSFVYATAVSLLLLCTFAAQAQTDDYIITTKGDTVKCEVNISTWSSSPKYKIPGGKNEKITIDKVKEYYTQWNDIRFRAVYRDTSNKPEYLMVIESGPICLYQQQGNGGFGAIGVVTVSSSSWLISKNSDRAITLKTTSLVKNSNRQERKDALSEMLKDKPDVYNKYIAEDKFTFAQIRNLVHLYNTGEPYKKPKKKPVPVDDSY